MKKLNLLIGSLILAIAPIIQSCDNDGDNTLYLLQPTALVTVCPQPDESVIFQLTDDEQIIPLNMKKSPFGSKEVRALVNYSPAESDDATSVKGVNVNWIDSIRTKMPVQFNEADINKYGNDPLEIVDDWVTVAEDGYLTLRIRTVWGPGRIPHLLTLTYGRSEADAMEFELHHNADGDVAGKLGDAMIAFNLNQLLADVQRPAKIKLKWHSFTGEKSAEFTFNSNRRPVSNSAEPLSYNNIVE